MAKLKRCSHSVATAMLSSMTAIFLGYDLAVVTSTAAFPDADLKLLACIVVVSSFLGALTTVGTQGLLGDRHSFLLSAVTLCVGAVVRGLATNFAFFVVGIFINGVGMGQALMIIPAYTTDVTPSSSGCFAASHPDGFVYLGCVIGSICHSTGFAMLQAHHAWGLALAFSTAIPISLGIAILFMPESPRRLVSQDKLAKARRVLAETSATLEEAELRMLEINAELGIELESCSEGVPVPAHYPWTEEYGVWRELIARPTEPVHRALISALVVKVFQQASGIESILHYVQKAFRKVGVSSGSQIPSASVAFGCIIALCFAISLLVVELTWLFVLALANLCNGQPSQSPCHDPSCKATTRRQKRLKWVRGLSATMLISLMALVWIALGPARWPGASLSCPLWLQSSVMAMNRAVSGAILLSFVWLYAAIAMYGSYFVYATVAVVGWWFFGFCFCDRKKRCMEIDMLFEKKWKGKQMGAGDDRQKF